MSNVRIRIKNVFENGYFVILLCFSPNPGLECKKLSHEHWISSYNWFTSWFLLNEIAYQRNSFLIWVYTASLETQTCTKLTTSWQNNPSIIWLIPDTQPKIIHHIWEPNWIPFKITTLLTSSNPYIRKFNKAWACVLDALRINELSRDQYQESFCKLPLIWATNWFTSSTPSTE
jgi:hypothetical protein